MVGNHKTSIRVKFYSENFLFCRNEVLLDEVKGESKHNYQKKNRQIFKCNGAFTDIT